MLNGCYFDKLTSPAERTAYIAIVSALRREERHLAIRSVGREAAMRAWRSAVFDNPDILSYPGLVFNGTSRGADVECSFEYTPISESARQLYEERLQRLKDRIRARLGPSPSDYDVCKAIYDVLACTVTYDWDLLREFNEMRSGNDAGLAAFLLENTPAFTPFGAVMQSRAVCQGISKLYKILCESFGVECAVAEACSEAVPEGGNPDHMLNIVEVDGSRAFVDVTDGLPVPSLPIVKYGFFLVSSRAIGREFRICDGFECTDDSLSYFARNGLVFRTEESLRRYLAAFAARPGCRRLRVQYTGELSDGDLEALAAEVMGYHCRDGYVFRQLEPRNGFCYGIIMDEKEKTLNSKEGK